MKKLDLLLGFCLIVSIVCSGCAIAQQGAILSAQSDMAKGRYESALKDLTQAQDLKKPAPDRAAYIDLLKALCYEKLGRPVEAKAMYKFVVDHFPGTESGYIAREKLSPDLVLKEVASAADYLTTLHDQNVLPGAGKDVHGEVDGPVPFSQTNLVYPFSWTFYFVPERDRKSFTNCYTVGRPDKDASWQLQRAWRTDRTGKTVEEWPVLGIVSDTNAPATNSASLRN